MKNKVKQITSWSFSRYSDYKQCPLKAKLKHLDKIAEPKSAAMERGSDIHSKAEGYIKGNLRTLPSELKTFADKFKMLRQAYNKRLQGMAVEDMWAFTSDWGQTTWDNWINCWIRIKLDCAYYVDHEMKILKICDWKTGKFRAEMNEEYIEQLELYALAALLIYPHVEKVVPELVYLDAGVVYPSSDEAFTFTQKDLPKLKKLWVKRTKAMLNDKIFAPRPNDKCRWCYYRASNKVNGGGQCKF